MSKSSFSEKYYEIYSGTFISLRESARKHFGVTPKVPALFRQVRQLKSGAKLLDVGCGIGGLLELFEREKQDIETFGIDLGNPPHFRSKAHFTRGSAVNLPFPDDSFDIVTCAHVIEHLTNPALAVAEILRVCRPGGMVYIEAPSPRSALMPFGFNFWDDPTHIRPHTKTSLRKLITEAEGDCLATGTKKSLAAIVLGLPYMIIGGWLKDPQARTIFPAYAFGHTIWAMGCKPGR